MNDLIRKILKEELDEYANFDDSDDFEKLSHDKHEGAKYIYQVAYFNRLPNIFKNGFSREYAASAGGNAYCRGLYTTFSLESSIKNVKQSFKGYGDTILKIAIKSYDRFLIYDEEIARETYGNKYRPIDQLKMFFGNDDEMMNKLKNSPFYKQIVNPTYYDEWTASNVQALLRFLGGTNCNPEMEFNLNKYDIRGFIFLGRSDGKVCIVRDYNSLIPVSYSRDGAKTWNYSFFTRDSFDKLNNNCDPLIFLKDTYNEYINPNKYRLINDYMRVQRKKDGRYNFVDSNLKVLSPMWFDLCSQMSRNHKALFKRDGERYYVGEDGYYEKENDSEPSYSFDDVTPD